jgi:hypothetical protein
MDFTFISSWVLGTCAVAVLLFNLRLSFAIPLRAKQIDPSWSGTFLNFWFARVFFRNRLAYQKLPSLPSDEKLNAFRKQLTRTEAAFWICGGLWLTIEFIPTVLQMLSGTH